MGRQSRFKGKFRSSKVAARLKSLTNAVARGRAFPEKEIDVSTGNSGADVSSASCPSLPRDGEEVGEEFSNSSETGMCVEDGKALDL